MIRALIMWMVRRVVAVAGAAGELASYMIQWHPLTKNSGSTPSASRI
jgi:hypothetical protein